MSDLVVQGGSLPSFLLSTGSGMEDLNTGLLSRPFLKMGHPMSDQMKKTSDRYIPALKSGDFYNSVTGEIFGQELEINVLKAYTTFAEIEKDGGVEKTVRRWGFSEFNSQIKKTCTIDGLKIIAANGNKIREEVNFLLLLVDHPECGIIMSSHHGGAIPGAKDLINKMNSQTLVIDGVIRKPHISSFVWHVASGTKSYEKGDANLFTDIRCLGTIKPEAGRFVEAALAEIGKIDTIALVNESLKKDYSSEDVPF